MRRTIKSINNLSLRKNIIRKAPIQRGIKHLCTSRAQNDALEATLSHSAQAQHSGVRIERFKAQRKEILMRRVLNLCDSLFMTVLNVSYCACEEPFIVLSTTVLISDLIDTLYKVTENSTI